MPAAAGRTLPPAQSRFQSLLDELAEEYNRLAQEAAPAAAIRHAPYREPAPTQKTWQGEHSDERLSYLSERISGCSSTTDCDFANVNSACVSPRAQGMLRLGSRFSENSVASDAEFLGASVISKAKFQIDDNGVPMRPSKASERLELSRPRVMRLDERWVELRLLNERLADENMSRLHVRVRNGRRLSTVSSSAAGDILQSQAGSSTVFRSASRCPTPVHPMWWPRLGWDVMGLILVTFDFFMIPLVLAWSQEMKDDGFLGAVQLFGSVFWSLDILVTFFTAVYENGELTFQRSVIAKAYVHSWLCFDVLVLAVDIFCQAYDNDDLDALDWVHGLRVFRLLRVVKCNHFGRTLEDTLASKGKQWLVLLVSVFKTLMLIMSGAHILTCLWYFVGNLGRERGDKNWLDDFGMIGLSMGYQYLKTFHWVVSQFTPSTYPGLMSQNPMEEVTAIFVIMVSMALMGSMVSRMVAMMNQLNAMVAERQRTQRQVQRYLIVNKIPAELSVRIQRCVEHGLEARMKAVAKPAQLSMLPQKLNAELTMAQVGYNFQSHPFFNLIIQAKLSVLSELWGAFKPAFYEIGDLVFVADGAARGMHFTSSGVYRLQFGIANVLDLHMHQDFTTPQWFAEASLFTSMTHSSTLAARSFGEVFLLTGRDFANAMSSSPIGIVAVFEYAQAFLRAARVHWESDVELTGLDLLPDAFSADAAQATELAEVVVSQAQRDGGADPSPSREPVRRVASCIQTNPKDTPLGFIRKVMDGSLDDAAMRAELEEQFPEVHPLGGTYKRAGLQDERDRAVLAMTSAFWLVRGEYESMVAGQHARHKLTEKTWAELQQAVRWVDADEEMIQAALVFLAIRGLGKARRFSRMCPPGPQRRHAELAVAFAMRELPLVVPSVVGLSESQFDLIKTSLELTADFSLQQMLQGEISPVSIHLLQRAADDFGGHGLKFYLFVQVCMMCGSEVRRDGEGSLYLTEANARILVTGLECLRQVEQEEARKLYWSYVSTRARMVDVSTQGPEDLAFARLICLTGAVDQEQLRSVRQAWAALGSPERKIFVEWFLRDGLTDNTFTFKFLPQYLANARSNGAVGIREALMVLLDTIERLLECGCMDSVSNMTVDMSDLAVIVREVRMPRGLTKAVEAAKIVHQQDKAAVVMTSRSWRLATAISTFKERARWDSVVQNQEGDDLDTSRRASMSASSAASP